MREKTHQDLKGVGSARTVWVDVLSRSKLSSAIGALLIVTGVLVPPSTLIGFLQATPVGLPEQLSLGVILFKSNLVILGLLFLAYGRMPLWDSQVQSKGFLSDPHRPFILATLAVVLLAACALRLYGLGSGLWYDEIYSYVHYVKQPIGEIVSIYDPLKDPENNHVLYTLLAHASFSIFGESTWSLRLPAVLFGIGSIWALYLLGCHVGTTREALLSAALLTFSYHHVWFSQNARGYIGLLFWTILATWLFLRGLDEARLQPWLLYATTAALGIYTHITMLFVIIGHFIIYLITLFNRRKDVWPNRWVGFFLGFCLAGFLTVQLYALILPQMWSYYSSFESQSVQQLLGLSRGTETLLWNQPLWTLLELARGMRINYGGSIVAIAALGVFGAGLVSFARTNPKFVLLSCVPPVLGAVVIIGMGHPLWPRFFFFAIGFGALVVVRGTMLFGRLAARLLELPSTKSIPIGTALCSGLILVSATSIPAAYAPKQDYEGALTFVEAGREPGDAVVTVGPDTFPYKNFYKTDWKNVETLKTLNAIRSRAKRTWLVYTLPPYLQFAYPEIMSSVQREFKVVEQFYGTLGDGTIFVCRSDVPPSRFSFPALDHNLSQTQ